MQKLKLIVLLLLSSKIYSQYGVINESTDKFGPCSCYLNEMRYYYNFNDLRKDTLRYPHTRYLRAAEFIQKGNHLIEAKLFDEKGNLVSGGDFTNGNGKLTVETKFYGKSIYNFKDGKLNDTSFFYTSNNRLNEYKVYKNNIMIYRRSFLFSKTEANYDEDGFAHGNTNVYGFKRKFLYVFPYYIDTYKGKLYQRDIFEHGNLMETIVYKKDGSVKHTSKFGLMKKYKRRENKNCL